MLRTNLHSCGQTNARMANTWFKKLVLHWLNKRISFVLSLTEVYSFGPLHR
jgi:hypothetical protein